MVNRFSRSDSRVMGTVAANKRTREEEEEEDNGKRVELQLAGEIRAFTERIVGMERKKMQMMKEIERWRIEKENKRMEMILDSQRKIIDMISTTFGG